MMDWLVRGEISVLIERRCRSVKIEPVIKIAQVATPRSHDSQQGLNLTKLASSALSVSCLPEGHLMLSEIA